jgi:predicted Zn-dependent peptidase
LNSSNIRESAGEFGVLWRIPNQTGIRRHSLNFLSSTLGNSIQDKLSNKMAISYVAGANLDWDYNVGTLSMTGKARSADLADAISGCFDVVGTLKNNAVSRAEIDSYKRRIEYSFAANEETVEGKLSILMGELDGQENVKEFFEGVSAITPESVMEAANYALPDSDGDYILSILDPLKDNE